MKAASSFDSWVWDDLETAMKRYERATNDMESYLKKVPLSALSLGVTLDRTESAWSEVMKFYNRRKVLTQDEQAKVEPIASGELQALYEDLHD